MGYPSEQDFERIALEAEQDRRKGRRLIYLASSWRNVYYDIILKAIRYAVPERDVYDFRENGFSWSKVSSRLGEGLRLNAGQLRQHLNHSLAVDGFQRDRAALGATETCVLILPCGRSAHLEAGYCVGQGKETIVYIPKPEVIEPELMYALAGISNVTDDLGHLISVLKTPRRIVQGREG